MGMTSTERVRAWRAANPIRNKANSQKWYQDNKDQHLKRCREWSENNPEKVCEYGRKHYKKNKDVVIEKANKNYATPYGRARLLCKLASYRAAKKNLPFSLDVHDLASRIENGVCEVTGLPLDLGRGWNGKSFNPYGPSLDQIEAGKGYTPDNVRVVCLAINTACGTWGLVAFEPFAKAIIESLNKAKSKAA